MDNAGLTTWWSPLKTSATKTYNPHSRGTFWRRFRCDREHRHEQTPVSCWCPNSLAAATWVPCKGSLPARGMISVHIDPPACLDGRIYSLFSEPFAIHVFYPENKEEHSYAQMPNQCLSRWWQELAAEAAGARPGPPLKVRLPTASLGPPPPPLFPAWPPRPHESVYRSLGHFLKDLSFCSAASSLDGSVAGWLALAIMSRIFWRQPARFRNWQRLHSEVRISSPALLILFLCVRAIFCRMGSVIQSALARWNLTSALEFTLLTFWPPGPLLRQWDIVKRSTGMSSLPCFASSCLCGARRQQPRLGSVHTPAQAPGGRHVPCLFILKRRIPIPGISVT